MQHSLHRRVVVPGPQAAGLAATRAAVLVAVLSIPIVAPIIAPLAQAADSEAGDCSFAVTVAEGDTLSLIAERFLGDVLAYRRLHDLNRAVVGPDPAILEVGTVLDVPCPPGGLETAVPAGPGDTARAVAAPGPVDAPAPGATGDAPAGGADLSGDGAAVAGEAVPGQDATAPEGILPTNAAAVDTTAVDAAAVDAAPVDGTTLPIAVRGPLPGATGFVEEAALARRLSSGTRPQLIDLRAGDEASMTFLPGAVRVPEGWSGAAAATETGRAAAAALLARHDIRTDRPIVLVVADGGRRALGRAALAAWVLRLSGAASVEILWGGHAAWSAAARPEWASPAIPRARPDPALAPALNVGAAAWRAVVGGEAEGRVIALDKGAVPAGPGRVVAALPRLDAASPDALALASIAWIKALPVAWEREPVGMTAIRPGDAALAWFLASELVGIPGVWVVPPLDVPAQATAAGPPRG